MSYGAICFPLSQCEGNLPSEFVRGSCGTFASVPSSWSRGSKLKHCVPALGAVERKDRFILLKCRSCSSIGASLARRPKSKPFKVSAFKDYQFDDSNNGSANSSKYLNNAVEVSYLKHKSEESSVESSKVQSDVPAVEATTRSLAIQNLFKSWLVLLRAPSQTLEADKVLEESSVAKSSEMPNTSVKQKGGILKAVWCRILGLDTAIRIPFLLFTPLYLAVNLVYGMEVSKELTPLWILGPIVVTVYVKTFQALCGLYAFGFKQTANVIKKLPVYYSLVHDHIVHGKLKEAMRIHILQPLADIRHMNYSEVTRRKTKVLQGWLVDRQLDLIELVWPWYCRTIRFLKRTHLV
ncbi:uncharacterized protein LOC125191338 isoform X3 [Salvia hispanica]|uniref:uncharacterized protein LOC125191338 isoform X3 n=1 Tax=Salvia hispanica TaxID=49212 RepID=UPI002009207A|nr:uncharacterized protein LOC125191338 isoform X3 [Salvia hispanica]